MGLFDFKVFLEEVKKVFEKDLGRFKVVKVLVVVIDFKLFFVLDDIKEVVRLLEDEGIIVIVVVVGDEVSFK